jgi:hypothetical protein
MASDRAALVGLLMRLSAVCYSKLWLLFTDLFNLSPLCLAYDDHLSYYRGKEKEKRIEACAQLASIA